MLVAFVAAVIAFGVIGWRRDQRNVAARANRVGSGRARLPGAGGSGQESWEARKPSASKPLATRMPVDVRARRDQSSERPGRLDKGLTREQKSLGLVGGAGGLLQLATNRRRPQRRPDTAPTREAGAPDADRFPSPP